MKTAGIIAEYNPFHNGHQYHIEETRRRTGADYVVVVLSGSFIQRGAPAVLNKYDRARMALLSGADLVFELPAVAALQSAEGFATGGICLLEGLGVVDTVSCGCESADADPDLFASVVSLLAQEPAPYREALTASLHAGASYPRARELAVRACLGREGVPDGSGTDALGLLLSSPNNILALEYARAIQRSGNAMQLCLIPRQGSARHGEAVRDVAGAGGPAEPFTSAAAIRALLFSPEFSQKTDADTLARFVPADVCGELLAAREKHALLCEDDFSDLLLYAITNSRDHLDAFGPARFDLANRITKKADQFTNWSGFTKLLKTKNQTYTAISRCLAQILLGITRDDLALAASYGNAPYARLLGFRTQAAPLLGDIRQDASIPVLTRLAQDYPALGEDARHLFDFDVQAAALYRQVLRSRSGETIKPDLRQPVITIS